MEEILVREIHIILKNNLLLTLSDIVLNYVNHLHVEIAEMNHKNAQIQYKLSKERYYCTENEITTKQIFGISEYDNFRLEFSRKMFELSKEILKSSTDHLTSALNEYSVNYLKSYRKTHNQKIDWKYIKNKCRVIYLSNFCTKSDLYDFLG